MNRATLLGNVGRDPEVRHTQDGKPIVNLSLATSDTWRDKTTGERKEKTEWHRVVIFNEHIAKVAEQYVKKGTKVLIEGAIRTRQYTDSAGVERYSTEIVIEAFRGTLELISQPTGGKGPGFSDSEDAYGKTTTRESTAPQERQPVNIPPRDFTDEVPF